MKSKTSTKNAYVWYVGYGSNLFRERFNYYITGKKFRWRDKPDKGCKDKTLSEEGKPIKIPYPLYFAKNASSWGNGGVAFISTKKDESKQTYARMWKISAEQFLEIWDQEGTGWYNISMYLGQDESGIPILTITNNTELTPKIKPSDQYVKTVIAGLKETYNLSDEKIIEYLMEKPGVKGHFKERDLILIFQSIQS